LLAFDRGLDRTVLHAVDHDAVLEFIQRRLVDPAEGPHAISPHPAGRRQFQVPRQPAVIGQQQQPLRRDVQPADRYDARHTGRQALEDRGASLFVARGGDQAGWLVIAPQPRRLGVGHGFAIHDDGVARLHHDGRTSQLGAVDNDASLGDPAFGVAAGAQAGARHALGDALALGRVVGFGIGHAARLGGPVPRG
jgi:hypothetical protein